MVDAPATPSTAVPAPPALPAPPAGPANTPDTTTALYQAILGEVHAEYYLAVFERIDNAEHWRAHWNWAASLCTLSWLVFRQLWSTALYYAGAVVAGFLLIFGIGRLVLQFSPTTELILAGIFVGVLFAVPGLLGTTLLHADCRRRMTLALRSSNTDEEARLALVKQASTRRRLGFLVAINILFAALVGSAAMQWLEFSANAGSLARPATADSAPMPAAPAPATASSASALPAASPVAPLSATATPPTVGASSPAAVTAITGAATATVTATASAPVVPERTARPASAVTSQPAAAASPVTGTAGRSAQGPVPWEAMKIAPPRPDVAPTPTIEPGKHKIESPWPGAAPTPATGDRQTAASTSAKNSATEKQWLINVGLFAVEENARNAYRKLDAAGLPATLQPLNTSKGQRFRLRVGPYTSRADADAAAGKIRALALDAVVLENKPLQTQ